VLADEALHPDSNFFLAGGDSLQMTRVLLRVRAQLGIELRLHEVAAFCTPRRMALQCARNSGQANQPPPGCTNTAASLKTSSPVTSSPIARAGTTAAGADYPASFGQQSLWVAEQLAEGCGLYNTAVSLRLRGALNIPVLEQALIAVLTQHSVLGSSFRFEPATAVLLAHLAPAPAKVLTVEHLAPAQVCGRLRFLAAQAFDLARGPLWRFHLLLAGEEQHLLLCLHHGVTDGWSGGVLLHTLATAYNALCREPGWQVPATDSAYSAFCRQEQSAKPGPEALAWWRTHLQGADRIGPWYTALASDPRQQALRWPFRMRSLWLTLPELLVAAERERDLAQGATLFTCLLTAFRLALASVSGCREACIALPVAGRNSPAQENSVGYYTNLLAVRASVDPEATPLRNLRCLHHELLVLLDNSTVPFPLLVRELQPALLPSGNVWCDILFAFQNLPQPPVRFAGLEHAVEQVVPRWGQYPLKVEIFRQNERWQCRLDYAHALLDSAFIRTMAAEFSRQIMRFPAADKTQLRVRNSCKP
jgi:hypothetical protein